MRQMEAAGILLDWWRNTSRLSISGLGGAAERPSPPVYDYDHNDGYGYDDLSLALRYASATAAVSGIPKKPKKRI